MSRTSGTWLFDEREVHVRNTYAYNTWQYYPDTAYYGVKTFAVEVQENVRGRPFGNIYELHYTKHREEIRQNSFHAQTVDVTFKPTHWQDRITRTIHIMEYNDNWRAILGRYGEAESVRHNLSSEDENRLADILQAFRERRAAEAVPASVDSYVQETVKERFREYGYTRDDMTFTTPDDAYAALRRDIPVYILYPDNTAEKVHTTADIDHAVYDGRMIGMNGQEARMRDLEKSGYVKWLCEMITNTVENYENGTHPIYFDYDSVIGLLDQTRTRIAESARCPRPDDLPPELPWLERLYGGDEALEPCVYDGGMSYEDYQGMVAESFTDDRFDENGESEDWEL
jgi:hypothetical protein